MKRQYIKPLITIEELLKQDVFLLSKPEQTNPEGQIVVDGNDPYDVTIP
ncbi:MAG: hypothetical protein K6F88_07805 [Ruminococcus sp.]|nr:hypothetical protein [Ruminococcus sp.]